jgi:YaiO family outer membrane protein
VRRALLALALLAGRADALELEGGLTHEQLTNDRPDWNSLYVEAAHDFAPRQTLYGLLRETERFDLRDSEIAAAYYHPFDADWTGLIEASYSPNHNVLPEASVLGHLSWAAGSGWVLSGGTRFSEYTQNGTRVVMGGVERYFGSYRAAYTLYNGKPEGESSASSHRLAFDYYYYGERSRIGVAVTWGREVEYVGPPTGIIVSDVRAFALLGRHWLTPAWALTWELGTHEQGDLYRRTGGRLGLRHRF